MKQSPHVGQRVVSVMWKEGQPFVLTGEVMATGKAGRGRKVLLKDGSQHDPGWFSSSVREAFEREIDRLAVKFGVERSIFLGVNESFDPWRMVKKTGQLNRLARKLEKHGIQTR